MMANIILGHIQQQQKNQFDFCFDFQYKNPRIQLVQINNTTYFLNALLKSIPPTSFSFLFFNFLVGVLVHWVSSFENRQELSK